MFGKSDIKAGSATHPVSMSALGQKRTYAVQCTMPFFNPKADTGRDQSPARFAVIFGCATLIL
ncbi:MAG TPA: hypothetical protein VEJ43_07865, partial [Pseudolabrys sp.]|nr:hypothetical protein [Pseudolabrys sp.]